MSRQTKAGAISALLIGLLVLVVALSTLDTPVSAVARLQRETITLTPCDDDEDDGDCSEFREDLTATAEYFATQTEVAIEESDEDSDDETPTPTTTVGVGTPTTTPTLSPTTSVIATPTTAPTLAVPIAPEERAPEATPTVQPDSALTCFPGQPLPITGNGPAHAAFLLYFDQRVVSGGSVSSSGRFATTLVVGRERAGVYPVTVRVRGTNQVLLQTSCAVPDVTPTYVPRARALP